MFTGLVAGCDGDRDGVLCSWLRAGEEVEVVVFNASIRLDTLHDTGSSSATAQA